MTLDIDVAKYGLLQSITNLGNYGRSVDRFREAGILLPTFAQLADPRVNSSRDYTKVGRDRS